MSNVNYSGTRLKRVNRDYGCRNRMPHDFEAIFEDDHIKVERCKICNKKSRFKKHFKGRIDNRAYLEAHARNFAQGWGRTRQLYMKLYKADKTIITL